MQFNAQNTKVGTLDASRVAIGGGAGVTNQQTAAVAIGQNAGAICQQASTVAIGACAGVTNQHGCSIIISALGCSPLNASNPGLYIQPLRCAGTAGGAPQIMGYCNTTKEIVFGLAGSSIINGSSNVAINTLNGPVTAAVNGTSVANITSSQLAIGGNAGATCQQVQAIAIGQEAAQFSQQATAIAIGAAAGRSNQQACAIAIGHNTATSSQHGCAIAIGACAGQTCQGSKAIAIGTRAGLCQQGNNSIVIGACAGVGFAGANSIIIGFKGSIVAPDSILLNASGTCLSKCNPGFFATSIRDQLQSSSIPAGTPTVMGYCFASNEITANVLLSTTGSVIGAFLHGDGSNITNLPAGSSISNASTSIQTICAAACGSILFTVGGNPAGGLVQNTGAISFGLCTVAGRNSIAIGKNAHACSSCAILLNATGSTIATCSSGFFVDPMRSVCVAGGTPQIMGYCNTTREIVFNVPTVSAFTIAAKPLMGTAGQMIAVTDSATTGGKATDGMIAFWDLSNTRWSYIIDNTAV